jgi:hypothetical protein
MRGLVRRANERVVVRVAAKDRVVVRRILVATGLIVALSALETKSAGTRSSKKGGFSRPSFTDARPPNRSVGGFDRGPI